MLPFAVLALRSPPALPTHVSPVELLITALPSTAPSRTSPVAVATSAGPVACSTLTSPVPLLTLTVAARSTRTAPVPVLMRQVPSGPSQAKSAVCALPYTCEPAGSSTVTSIDPPPPRGSHERDRGALTTTWSFAWWTCVIWAALTCPALDASLGRTSTTVSSRSEALIRTSPAITSIVAETGPGVSKVGMAVFSWRLVGCKGSADPAGVGPAAGAATGARARGSGVAGERGGHGADDPRVDRQPLPGGGLLDAGLEVLGQAEVDAGGGAVVGLRRRGRVVDGLDAVVGRRGGHHEVGLAGAQAQLDRAGRELARDLVGGGGQGVEQHQPGGGLERGGQPLGERAGILAARLGGDEQLAAEVLGVGRQVHDAIVPSLWRHSKCLCDHPMVSCRGRTWRG